MRELLRRKPLRVLVVSQYWFPENGVPQRRWTWLSRILRDSGAQVSVVAPWPSYRMKVGVSDWWKAGHYRPSKGAETGSSEEQIYRTPYLPIGSSLTQRALNQASIALCSLVRVVSLMIVKRERHDVVIGTVPALPTAIVVCIAAKTFKVPYVIDLRDAWPDLLAEAPRWNRGTKTNKSGFLQAMLFNGPFRVVSLIAEKALNIALSNAAGILVTSHRLQRQLERTYPEKARLGTIQTVRNVFPVESSVEKRRPSSCQGSSLNVLYAGTLGRAQNLENAIRASEIAKEMGTSIHLRFVGDGAAKQALGELAAASPVDIEFSDQKDAESLHLDYQWADTALVHLTNWEPLDRAIPSKTYELMIAGVHISGVLSGEAADLITELKSGDVVPPEDPLALACLWIELAQERWRLSVDDTGKRWVENERSVRTPRVLSEFFRAISKLG